MFSEILEVGPVPCNEDCEQLGPNYDPIKALAECRRFIEAIRATVGPEPEGARLTVNSNKHDFGTYYEVAVLYDADNADATAYAFRVDSDAPSHWPSQPSTHPETHRPISG